MHLMNGVFSYIVKVEKCFFFFPYEESHGIKTTKLNLYYLIKSIHFLKIETKFFINIKKLYIKLIFCTYNKFIRRKLEINKLHIYIYIYI